MIHEELNIICKLILIDDDELFEMCIDSLRAFDNELGHSFIKRNPQIIIEVEKRINIVGNASKRMLEDLKKIRFYKVIKLEKSYGRRIINRRYLLLSYLYFLYKIPLTLLYFLGI